MVHLKFGEFSFLGSSGDSPPLSNSRFESDAAGGVVQLRKPVEFEISNFRAVPFCDQNMRVD